MSGTHLGMDAERFAMLKVLAACHQESHDFFMYPSHCLFLKSGDKRPAARSRSGLIQAASTYGDSVP